MSGKLTITDYSVKLHESDFQKNKICFTISVFQTNVFNCRYWSDENPYVNQEHHTQLPQKLNVWADSMDEHITGPFFINDNLNGDSNLKN